MSNLGVFEWMALAIVALATAFALRHVFLSDDSRWLKLIYLVIVLVPVVGPVMYLFSKSIPPRLPPSAQQRRSMYEPKNEDLFMQEVFGGNREYITKMLGTKRQKRLLRRNQVFDQQKDQK